MPHFTCAEDFEMESGHIAFRAGESYEWRWATDDEHYEHGVIVAADGELGEHLLSMEDVEAITGCGMMVVEEVG